MQLMKEKTAPDSEKKAEAAPLTAEETAQAIMKQLLDKASGGDLDAIVLLKETAREAKLEKLRKELFGI
ncbi:hypothetical protein JN06_02338 [Bacteroides zoogleoformans]|uniref:Uncharacterized protein n=2 Tax=Bacteroides zoogleoformans TaxID=28119 RepID=A0ABN5IIJ1_9BACE|nr:hypothetical protein C4H11_04805 [Bacteroides zoogleoformans]TWJ11246.1 hypothetical protein JN06_02338 [Bacteroides zoogleoformans]